MKKKDKPPLRPAPVSQPSFCMISLGCSKNTVDTERLLALLLQDGFLLTDSAARADLCLVNTCGFIERAREEVREVLEELHRERQTSGGPSVIVALGCLVGHHAAREFNHLRQADHLVSFGDYLRLPALARAWIDQAGAPPPPVPAPDRQEDRAILPATFHRLPRLITGRPHCVYLKIAEGCSNHCSFCAIPGIRGRRVSRPVAELLAEVQDLAATGAREINLIAQDTSSYGHDLPGRVRLPDLLAALGNLDYDGWFRLLYVFPGHFDDATLDLLGHAPFCPYIDMPLQHVNETLLRSMGRPGTSRQLGELLDRIRARIPAVALRTAFIVGYPGETEAHFEELLRFVADQRFDHLGAFAYSPEPGTRASALPGAVPEPVKQERLRRLMELQQGISRQLLRAKTGSRVEVMVDGETTWQEQDGQAGRVLAGRTRQQALDIDGITRIDGLPRGYHPEPGQVLTGVVTEAYDYDLALCCDSPNA